MNKIVTIERHILEKQKKYPGATGVFTNLLYDMALAAKLISREILRAGLIDILGAAGEENVYGEQQQKLDVFADETIFKLNDHTGRLCAMASEEHEDIIQIPPHFDSGKYILLYDPLDGSSNIDVDAPVGTIFAIHRKITEGPHGTMTDMLQSGRSLAAAGYVIYGSSTIMVYSTGQGVHGFTLDRTVGEFFLSHDNIRIPATPTYYSCNPGYEKYWTPGVRRYHKWLQGIEGEGRKPLGQRYIGTMVADFHRNLLKGGIYFYPGDLQNPAKPQGKLRLMFEAQAMAFLVEQAGGYASDGLGNILDIRPHDLHQRVPMFIGNRELVEQAEQYIQQYDQEWCDAYRPIRDRQPMFTP